MPIAVRAALAALLGLAAFAAQAQSPRERVAGIAAAIAAHYYDAERGQRIADDLRAAAGRGEYDRYPDPRDLATALTTTLQPLDRHFRVALSSDPTGPVALRRPGPAAAAPHRRGSYGLRRVEVLPGNLGYIDLREFADFAYDGSDQPARRAIEAALQLLAGTDALIIDLRDNGGGSPAMVGYLVSAFTAPGADIYNRFRERERSVSEAPPQAYPTPRLTLPLYVLISGRTGSAAESFAYTLKNAKRATVVGEASAGAANPGGEVDAGHGLRVFVSRGSPISPITGGNWEGSGVAPDVAVDSALALERARVLALQAVLALGLPDADTVEARWTLQALRAEAAPPQVALRDYAGAYGPIHLSERDGRLWLQRDRRPAWPLLPLGEDMFSVAGEPARRVAFERGADGAIVAMEIRAANGPSTRYRR